MDNTFTKVIHALSWEPLIREVMQMENKANRPLAKIVYII